MTTNPAPTRGKVAPRGAITWGELLRTEPFRAVSVPVSAGLDREVHAVRLVSDVEEIRSCRPGTVVVLDQQVATAAWAVPIALRYAWERNVRCVVCQLEPALAGGVTRLARRLSLPVGYYEGNLPDLALQLSAFISAPEAVRARHVASCAGRLARERTVPAMLAVLEEELSGVRVALCGPGGTTLVGSLPSQPWAGSAFRVALDDRQELAGRSLVAVIEQGAVAWAETIQATLEIARAHVVAAEASSLLDRARRAEVENWALAQLVRPGTQTAPGESPSEAAAISPGGLGWCLDGELVGIVLMTAQEERPGEGFDLALAAAWDPVAGSPGPISHGSGWAFWETVPGRAEGLIEDEDERQARHRRAVRAVAHRLDARLTALALGVDMVGGLGAVASGPAGLRGSLHQAELAARAARGMPGRRVQSYTALGARAFIAAADSANLRDIAADILAPLLADREGEQLVQTLATYLDCGGSTSRAAGLLGLHRNTISARMERIRALGVDVDDPDRRLVYHLTSYLTGPMRPRSRLDL